MLFSSQRKTSHASFDRLPPILSLAVSFLIFLSGRAFSQGAGSATITGTVTDASGASVPGAEVTIRNTDTGIERKTQTSDAGLYTAAFLPPGKYEVQAVKTGFSAVVMKDLTLQVGQILTVSLSLSVQAAQ